MKRFRQFATGAILLVVGVAVGWNLPHAVPAGNQPLLPLGASVAPTSTGSVLFDFGDGRISSYAGVALIPRQSVWEFMQELERSRGVQISTRDYGGDLGIRVTGIGGVGEDVSTGRYWHYWVNQQFAEVGVSNYRLSPGDQVMWKYTTSQFRAETK
ncbi:MAG: DUF4430 domain-containing protein [Patescibacteria group bacterium]|nr:DUF4430 domain-containing protein [Patescibacteria group bacterium]